MKPIVALMLISLCFAARAQDAATALVAHLTSTPFFAFGGVGYAGVVSQGEIDFHLLMSQPRPVAQESFGTIYATGNAESKAYALAGIRELDPQEFERLFALLSHSNEKISTMVGCLVEKRSLIDVAGELKAGKYDYWIKRPPARPLSQKQKPLGGYLDLR